ncbi:MAG: tRNA (N6-threonylcarbamoyladenosine(37)-N6)-methyltransferase TrmO [Lentisphaeria bacterium]|nr:tRNA (N6-threonylcarbamoyladenosine(37)-N6)-methyltransferase TrmO [Lentisphaeria bacterium]
MKPIGVIHSCFNEKFGAPRQAGLVPSAVGDIELFPPYNLPEAWKGIDGFSHLWVIFLFNQTADQGWKPTVRPPRLGGNKRVGVFATRSNFRPNPIGLSVVKLETVREVDGSVEIRVSGLDMIDGTPVLDIKPYVPYADAVPTAVGGFADSAPSMRLTVTLGTAVEAFFDESAAVPPGLRERLIETLALDPRPAYHQGGSRARIYGTTLNGVNFKWRVKGTVADVFGVET